MRKSVRITELEHRVSGLELLVCELLKAADAEFHFPPITALEAARVVAEERYGTLPPRRDNGR
jgi:hypothetical protein